MNELVFIQELIIVHKNCYKFYLEFQLYDTTYIWLKHTLGFLPSSLYENDLLTLFNVAFMITIKSRWKK